MKKTILIIPSDPDSVNYKILKKSLFFFKKKNKNKYLFIGDKLNITKFLKYNKLNFINIANKKNKTKTYLKNCFQTAFNLIKKKSAHGLINLPLNKKNLPNNSVGFTEYLAKNFKKEGSETMLMYSNKFSVSPLTTHIAIKDIHKKINIKMILKNIININNFYKRILGIKSPRICILGLNPHAGIDFKKKTEENKILIPAIKILKKNGINIIGPDSADSVFNNIYKNKINCIVGNYHDQVLPAFKYINKFKGANITLGLDFIRMSPDHGTGKNLKKINEINNDSFIFCLNFFEKYYNKI